MHYFQFRLALLATAAGALHVPSVAYAEDGNADAQLVIAASGEKNFKPDFFAAYAPVTALDMVKRIPGFSINEGDGRRGFGENAGNVLIDGDRPSTKSDDILTILSRIAATEVEYIALS